MFAVADAVQLTLDLSRALGERGRERQPDVIFTHRYDGLMKRNHRERILASKNRRRERGGCCVVVVERWFDIKKGELLE